jgi:glycerol uptake facilitator-like aquaporin
MKKYIAEALGTFTLALVVALSIAHQVALTPYLAALTVGIFVYTIGHISGTHINPAITIGAWSIKKISTYDAVLYILFQFIGAAAAFIAVSGIAGVPHPIGAESWVIVLAEALGAFFLAFGIASVIYGKTSTEASGVVIGGSLFLGVLLAAFIGSNGVLNPAVAFGIGSFSFSYALSPILGAVLGMQAYKYLGK